MATAATNLLFQPSPFKWKLNQFRPLRPLLLPAQPLKLISTVKAQDKSHISLQYHPRPAAKKLQPWDLKSSNSSTTSYPKSNSVWRFAVKVTAGVVLGALLLMYRPKPFCSYILGDCGLSLYPCAPYFVSLPVLSILCLSLAGIDPSKPKWNEHWSNHWYEWYKKQANYFLLFLVIAHVTWAWRHNPATLVTLNIQVNLSNAGRALHSDLNRIAETNADTSTYKGVISILKETEATFLKHPDCFISACIYAVDQYDGDFARFMLNEISLEERYPVTNVKNLKAESSTSQKSANEIQDEHIREDANLLDIFRRNKYDVSQIDFSRESSTSQISAIETQDEYMEVVILVVIASKHDDDFPRVIKSVDDSKEALRLLTVDPIYPYVVEVLWRPKSSSSKGRRRLWFR
uniref:uncharacterized protein LOC105350021 n=1 Tax=Fragaria vesca subsp. vesca TaxID=101020 RepID=UPI0005CB2A76|nr:PREDICTED: uncharacterized protein LOC105350021 [Fragaria vesca subsp. vesca]